jgi:hypothetical protein
MATKLNGFFETGSQWEMPNIRGRISRLILDYSISVSITTQNDVIQIEIENDFLFNDKRVIIGNPKSICPVLGILNKDTDKLIVKKTGEMSLIGHDFSINIAPNDSFEAWQIKVNGKAFAICLPGGNIAFWDSNLN